MIIRTPFMATAVVLGLAIASTPAQAMRDYGTWSGHATGVETHIIPVNHSEPVRQLLVSAMVPTGELPGAPCSVTVRSYDEGGRFYGPVLARVLAGTGNAENQEIRFPAGLAQGHQQQPALRVFVNAGDAGSCHWAVSAHGDR